MFTRIRLLLGLSLLLAIGGFCLCGFGWTEGKVGAKATVEPVEADLAMLEAEAGKPLDNYHLKIGPHYACYYCTVYSYQTKKGAPRKAEANTKLSYAFYPIVSPSNPDVQDLPALEKKHGGLSKVPEDELTLPTRFVVLVKTTRFKNVGDLPDDAISHMDSVQGLVINEISSLGSDEKKLIQEEFPDIDFKKVLILEEGRKPFSTTTASLMMFGGLALIGAGIVVFFIMVIVGLMGLFGGRK
jgi:hypothetical protein